MDSEKFYKDFFGGFKKVDIEKDENNLAQWVIEARKKIVAGESLMGILTLHDNSKMLVRVDLYGEQLMPLRATEIKVLLNLLKKYA